MLDTILVSLLIDLLPQYNRGWIKNEITDINGLKIKYYKQLALHYTYYPLEKKLFIEGSIPKIYYHNNYQELTKQNLTLALEKFLETASNELNVPVNELNINDLNIHKVDYCKNWKTNKVPEYIYYISKTMLPRQRTPIHYRFESVTFPSTTRGVKFYDKFRECLSIEAKNILRMELRILHQKTFKRLLGSEKRKEPVKLNEIINYNFYKTNMTYFLEKLFPYDNARLESHETIMVNLLNKYTPTKALAIYGLQAYISNCGYNQLSTSISKSTWKRLFSCLKKEGINGSITTLKKLTV